MRKTLLVIGILLVVGTTIYLVTLVSMPVVTALQMAAEQNPGPFDRQALEAIVSQVRSTELKPGEKKEFTLGSLSNPQSLEPAKPGPTLPMQPRGLRVWGAVSVDGGLTVVIETRNLGHAGAYGFVYSDIPLSDRSFHVEGNWFRIDVPGDLDLVQPDMQIDDHWWKVLGNFD